MRDLQIWPSATMASQTLQYTVKTQSAGTHHKCRPTQCIIKALVAGHPHYILFPNLNFEAKSKNTVGS